MEMQSGHIAGVVGLQAECFPPPFPAELLWKPQHLRSHLEAFPEGQFVAMEDTTVVGSASALLIGEDAWAAHLPWEKVTGGHHFSSHDPRGTTLYGADVSVHPDRRLQGIARGLYHARFELVRKSGLRRYGTACRIPGYSASSAPSPEEYCQDVAAGAKTDPTLTPLVRMGCRFVAVAHGYMDDPESAHCAAVLEWLP